MLIAAVPATRPVLRDDRVVGLSGREVAHQALVRIPLGTVLWEETAFRREYSRRRCAASCPRRRDRGDQWRVRHLAYRPTAAALRINGLADSPGALAGVSAGVAATAAGGVLLSWLRTRSGSLAAPILLHLATNCGGALTAWVVARLEPQDTGEPHPAGVLA